MKKDAVITGAAAMILASGIALSAKALFQAEKKKPAPVIVEQSQPADSQILVVSRDIHPGDFIDSTALSWKSVPADGVPPFSLERNGFDRKTLSGVTVRKPLLAGEALTEADVIRAGDPGFLATVLAPGNRAVSIPTSAVESSFGLIAAGDHVDVILSLNASGKAASDEGSMPFLRSQTILSNVRVLALNNRIDSLAPGNDESDSKKKKAPRSFSTVTLEVTPQMAERLTIAKELGDLVLALRPMGKDGGAQPANSVTTVAQTTEIYRPSSKVIRAYRGERFEKIPLGAGSKAGAGNKPTEY